MITFFSLFNFSTITSYACSCAGPNTVEEELEQSSVVFSGKVVEIVDENKNKFKQSSADRLAVIFEVEEYWKGLNQKQITVYTERSSVSCGYEFNLNAEYLVYAHEANGALNVNRCSRTTPLVTAEEDISELEKGEKPIEQISNVNKGENHIPTENSTNNNKIYIILLILGLLIVGIYILRRIRK
ncbi:hypothetical protein AEA09_03910 [Lysinibacillus contaminans]|uniref:Tissue inhibitor of metalloproteinase n=2 Tax=Lysinibacillus contaminans TaxID=1293441 RepID=A0ABR5K5W5_9BACI|nr:hypothetical protein AEA09_03910 [Lysinibacillus contaminans]